jgi:hypothetical protein
MANGQLINDDDCKINTPFYDGLSVTNPVRTCQRRSFLLEPATMPSILWAGERLLDCCQ